jgi:holo-[acyl-carrier protein] synthase
LIIGIGLDLVEVARIERTTRRFGARALARLFTPGEVKRCAAARCPAESYAARFAAKEAVFKALGTGWGRGPAWHEVEVVSGPGGRPELRLSGRIAEEARARGVSRFHLTLTHTSGLAAAVVVCEA